MHDGGHHERRAKHLHHHEDRWHAGDLRGAVHDALSREGRGMQEGRIHLGPEHDGGEHRGGDDGCDARGQRAPRAGAQKCQRKQDRNVWLDEKQPGQHARPDRPLAQQCQREARQSGGVQRDLACDDHEQHAGETDDRQAGVAPWCGTSQGGVIEREADGGIDSVRVGEGQERDGREQDHHHGRVQPRHDAAHLARPWLRGQLGSEHDVDVVGVERVALQHEMGGTPERQEVEADGADRRW